MIFSSQLPFALFLKYSGMVLIELACCTYESNRMRNPRFDRLQILLLFIHLTDILLIALRTYLGQVVHFHYVIPLLRKVALSCRVL